MSGSREEILRRVRSALGDTPGAGEDHKRTPFARSYRTESGVPPAERVQQFITHVSEYKARVSRTNSAKLPEIIAESCKRQGVKKLVIPPGLDESWLYSKKPTDFEYLRDEKGLLTHQELDESDGVLTGCFSAVAQTGTIVLNGGPGQGKRVLTLLPDYHLCVVREEQITGILPEAIAKLDDQMKESGPPVTFISGPSATSDIELSRVEGVHGPRRLEVIVVRSE